ncbi:NAD(P)-dependent oxidoreductase [Candidatus Puniceispirillum sp.]|uniref:NAD(P)-dependent oxidoreductase n=1 Tax=Candidatus Puniceispirillum sp. TaxID=2026719 RepID=UPI001ED6610D|nr:NAD(P)-dependent oxidoreductase [Candidatus Puniceispirillum sp.]
MTKVGIVGIGDMGSGIAKNLIAGGFDVHGIDTLEKRMQNFVALGGTGVNSLADVATDAAAVFVMVMTGAQAKGVIFGDDGLAAHMPQGTSIILTATIKPAEASEIATGLEGTGIHLIDSPVSGGFPGAQGGTLTMMAAGNDTAMENCRPFMEAISGTIHKVGDAAPAGQTVKACLQSLIGSIFSATFEAATLAAKAGVPGEILYNVFSTSGASSGITNNALQKIIDRQFEGTGSHIATMHKDLTISLALAEELGVPLHTASTAMQLFHAGKTKYPDGDNWVVTRVLEEIVGAELHR